MNRTIRYFYGYIFRYPAAVVVSIVLIVAAPPGAEPVFYCRLLTT